MPKTRLNIFFFGKRNLILGFGIFLVDYRKGL
jgi:hypothetical protein